MSEDGQILRPSQNIWTLFLDSNFNGELIFILNCLFFQIKRNSDRIWHQKKYYRLAVLVELISDPSNRLLQIWNTTKCGMNYHKTGLKVKIPIFPNLLWKKSIDLQIGKFRIFQINLLCLKLSWSFWFFSF